MLWMMAGQFIAGHAKNKGTGISPCALVYKILPWGHVCVRPCLQLIDKACLRCVFLNRYNPVEAAGKRPVALAYRDNAAVGGF